jgi:predicted regulator of Ras-like GTPase activity (Roadblock/LC7/MglB family)
MGEASERSTDRSLREGRGSALTELMEKLVEASPDFEGAVLVSREGLVVAAAWSSGSQVEHLNPRDDSDIGAVAVRAFDQSDEATDALDRGALQRMILMGARGNMVITQAGPDALCVVLLKPEAKMGVASFEAARISGQVAQVLG